MGTSLDLQRKEIGWERQGGKEGGREGGGGRGREGEGGGGRGREGEGGGGRGREGGREGGRETTICIIILIFLILPYTVPGLFGFREKGKVVLLGVNARVGRSAQLDDMVGMFGENIRAMLVEIDCFSF